MISTEERETKSLTVFVPLPIKLLRESKLSSLVNMCESVSKGSSAKNIRQVQGLLMLDTKSAKLMETTSCLNSPSVTLAYGGVCYFSRFSKEDS